MEGKLLKNIYFVVTIKAIPERKRISCSCPRGVLTVTPANLGSGDLKVRAQQVTKQCPRSRGGWAAGEQGGSWGGDRAGWMLPSAWPAVCWGIELVTQ